MLVVMLAVGFKTCFFSDEERCCACCRYVVIASGCASCPKLSCERPGCGTLFCYHCKQTWHPNQTCDAARAERLANARSSFSCSQDSSSHSTQSDRLLNCATCSISYAQRDPENSAELEFM